MLVSIGRTPPTSVVRLRTPASALWPSGFRCKPTTLWRCTVSWIKGNKGGSKGLLLSSEAFSYLGLTCVLTCMLTCVSYLWLTQHSSLQVELLRRKHRPKGYMLTHLYGSSKTSLISLKHWPQVNKAPPTTQVFLDNEWLWQEVTEEEGNGAPVSPHLRFWQSFMAEKMTGRNSPCSIITT